MQADWINPNRCSLIGLIQACPIVRLFALAAYTTDYNEILIQSIKIKKFMKDMTAMLYLANDK